MRTSQCSIAARIAPDRVCCRVQSELQQLCIYLGTLPNRASVSHAFDMRRGYGVGGLRRCVVCEGRLCCSPALLPRIKSMRWKKRRSSPHTHTVDDAVLARRLESNYSIWRILNQTANESPGSLAQCCSGVGSVSVVGPSLADERPSTPRTRPAEVPLRSSYNEETFQLIPLIRHRSWLAEDDSPLQAW